MIEQENIEKLYTKVNFTDQAEWLAYVEEHLDEVKDGGYRLSQRKNYFMESHRYADHVVEAEYLQAKAKKAAGCSRFSREKWICRLAAGKTFGPIGTVVDYQVPLKTPQGNDNSGLGEIDLLALNGDTLYLLEVKEPDNTRDSPLRAILEIYTYWKQLGGDDCRLFSGHEKVHGAKKAKKALLLFENEKTESIYQKLFYREGHERLSELMKELDVECFVGTLRDSDGEELIDVRPAAL